jgi:uncharacterized membrane protein YciS (DUF1049 family)
MTAVYLFAQTFFQISIGNANQFNQYLILGYFVMGLIATIYIVTLLMRQRNLQKDLQLMEQLLQNEDEN